MNIIDVDKKLNMRLVLSLRQENDLFLISRNSDTVIPVFTFSKEGKTFLSAFFNKKDLSQAGAVKLKNLGAETTEDSYVVTSRINNVQSMKVINELLSLPYIVLNRVDMKSGNMNFYFRFHSNKLAEVSEIVSRYVVNSEDARVVWLGPSPGLKWIMDLINSEYHLSIITYQVPADGVPDFLKSLPEHNDFLLEVRSNVLSNESFPCILYTRLPLRDNISMGIESISPNEGIYGIQLYNKFLLEVKKEADEKHIIRNRLFVRLTDGMLEVVVFLPTSYVRDYYSVLYSIARREGHPLIVKYLFEYEENAWEFL